MRAYSTIFSLALVLLTLTACNKQEAKKVDDKPQVVIAGPEREALQKAKELEKQMQIDAENRRKVIEVQVNPK